MQTTNITCEQWEGSTVGVVCKRPSEIDWIRWKEWYEHNYCRIYISEKPELAFWNTYTMKYDTIYDVSLIDTIVNITYSKFNYIYIEKIEDSLIRSRISEFF